jgi:hypothetical protein
MKAVIVTKMVKNRLIRGRRPIARVACLSGGTLGVLDAGASDAGAPPLT